MAKQEIKLKNKAGVVNKASQTMKTQKAPKTPKAKTYKEAWGKLGSEARANYTTYDKFETAAMDYNTKKYGSTNPTAEGKKTKRDLKYNVFSKAGSTSEIKSEEDTTLGTDVKKVSVKKSAEAKTTTTGTAAKGHSAYDARQSARKDIVLGRTAQKLDRKATRKQNRANRIEKRNPGSAKAARMQNAATSFRAGSDNAVRRIADNKAAHEKGIWNKD